MENIIIYYLFLNILEYKSSTFLKVQWIYFCLFTQLFCRQKF